MYLSHSSVAFRKKVYRSIDELQADLDVEVRDYSESRPHQGRWCFGKTPMQMFLDTMPMTKEKTIVATTLDTETRSLNQAPSVRSSLGYYN